MISFQREVSDELPVATEAYSANHRVTIDRKWWTVIDRKIATYRASEGELPFPAPPGQTRLSADLADGKGGFATVDLTADGAELFIGEFADFETLKLTNLRPVPGWSTDIAQEKNRTTALGCPACGGAVDLRAPGQSMSAVCGSCGTLIDTATPELQIIEKAEERKRRLAPRLPIGQRGKLSGIDYEVIGFVRRADQWAKWSEYLLFNPWHGFRWLVEFRGHWTFVTRLPSMADERGSRVELEDRTYKLFALSVAKVDGVLGEFYWKVQRGETARLSDYVAPPYILSRESYEDLAETTWSHGEYIDSRVIGEAFAVEKLPKPEGVYLNQPNRWAQRLREISVLFALAFLSLVVVQCSTVAQRQEMPLTEASFVFNRAATPQLPGAPFSSPTPTPLEAEKILTTPRFTVAGSGTQRVVIEAHAPVSNNWIGFDFDLVNTKTNASFPAALEVSAYHGTSSDGAWSEGSQTSSVAIPAVPPGEYFVTVESTADATVQHMPFTVRVRAGGVFSGNFLLMLVLVLAYPAYVFFRRHRFEAARWEQSDLSP